MSVIEQILKSKRRPKEKVTLIVEKVRGDKKLVAQLVNCLGAGSSSEKGDCVAAMQHLSTDEPDIVLPYIDLIVSHLGDAGARVKWEAAETVHNLAQRYPDVAVKAIPRLLENTSDGGTVVRWSAAYALTEIAYHNQGVRDELAAKFKTILREEKNNGVRNIYIKALKSFGRKPK